MASSDRPVALITGSSRGCGRAIAAELHRRNYRVVALNRTTGSVPWLREYCCDLTAAGEPDSTVRRVIERYGRLDVCVCNAVERTIAPVADLTSDQWNRAVAVNLTSVFRLIRASLPAVRVTGGIYVVMGSHAGSRFFEGGAAYSATKAALKAVVETVLLEERQHGVRATLLSPGAIANRDGDGSPYKMSPESVAACVGALVQEQPRDLVVGEMEIRPARLGPRSLAGQHGLARLQNV